MNCKYVVNCANWSGRNNFEREERGGENKVVEDGEIRKKNPKETTKEGGKLQQKDPLVKYQSSVTCEDGIRLKKLSRYS